MVKQVYKLGRVCSMCEMRRIADYNKSGICHTCQVGYNYMYERVSQTYSKSTEWFWETVHTTTGICHIKVRLHGDVGF